MEVKLSQLTTNILNLFLSKMKKDCSDGLLWTSFFQTVMNEYQAVMEARKNLRNCPFSLLKR